MLKNIKEKLSARGGIFIIVSLIVEKLSNVILMIIAARFMSVSLYGEFSYIRSLASSFLPFAGFGGNHALLRFGVKRSLEKKYILLFNAILYGTFFSIFILIVAKPILFQLGFLHSTESTKMFEVYIFSILSYFIFDLIRNFYRINDNNKRYSRYGLLYSTLTLLLGSFSLMLFDVTEFIITIVLVPFLVVFIENRFEILLKLKEIKLKNLKFEAAFWEYGVVVGAGAFLNQFFLQADILVLGYLNIESELLAKYKVATLLVYTALFVPNAFLVRDFTLLVEHAKDLCFLKSYLLQYLKHSFFVLLVFIPFFILASPHILLLLFGDRYEFTQQLQNILIFSFVGAVLLRMPFANVLNAVGKASWNVLNAILSLILTIFLLVLLTKEYGVEGSAYAMVFMFFISGIFSLILFLIYANSLKKAE